MNQTTTLSDELRAEAKAVRMHLHIETFPAMAEKAADLLDRVQAGEAQQVHLLLYGQPLCRFSALRLTEGHTPGPWRYVPERLHEGFHVAGRGPEVKLPKRGEVSVTHYAGAGADEEAEATARLIALAPDLLLALEAAREALRDCEKLLSIGNDPDLGNKGRWPNLVKKLRAVLAGMDQ